MTDQDAALMARHGIIAEAKTIYLYAGYRYERLADAVRYAEAQQSQPSEQGKHEASGEPL